MSDVEAVMSSLPRILFACRSRAGSPGSSGASGRLAGARGEGRVSAHQGHILAQLDAGDPTMVGELADSLGVTPSTMSLNLKRLREAGLVLCERDPDDRRVMNVRLTEAGERARDGARPLDADRVAEVLDGLWPEDRRRAVEALSMLAEAAETMLVAAAKSRA